MLDIGSLQSTLPPSNPSLWINSKEQLHPPSRSGSSYSAPLGVGRPPNCLGGSQSPTQRWSGIPHHTCRPSVGLPPGLQGQCRLWNIWLWEWEKLRHHPSLIIPVSLPILHFSCLFHASMVDCTNPTVRPRKRKTCPTFSASRRAK